MALLFKGVNYEPGSTVVAMINGERVEGKLQREGYLHFICHNNPTQSGRAAENRLGYNYSWAFKQESGEFLTDNVVIIAINSIGSIKENYFISTKLFDFFSSKNIDIFPLSNKLIFSEYNQFDVSENTGMIKLVNTTKSKTVDIKLGRFLNSYSKQCNELFNINLFNNKFIEKSHNDYILFQSGDYITVTHLKGKEILEGYKRENYQASKSTLGGSCMTDKIDYLELYVNNPDKVELISIKVFDKFVGRAFLWKTECGQLLMDKYYISEEWVGAKFDEIKQVNKYLTWQDFTTSDKILEVKLNTKGINKWPYIDTFQFADLNEDFSEGTFYTYPPSGYKMRFRSTSGSYEDFCI